MGFRENLKAEITYKAMPVKELALLTQISRRTIDNYLREDSSMPSAEAAVRIAGALGVTVEYLVTGEERRDTAPDSRAIANSLRSLSSRDREIVVSLIKTLRKMKDRRAAPAGDVTG